MEFIDFHLRAWQGDAEHIQVLVHSSPAGSMERPLTVAVDLAGIEAARRQFADGAGYNQFTLDQILDLGQHLAGALLPPQVCTLLDESLEGITPGDGLRLRLSLDDTLNNLPWEFLSHPGGADSLSSFLVLQPHISIVRGSPVVARTVTPSDETMRLVFCGALWNVGDRWTVKGEYEQLRQALQPVAALLSVDPFRPASGLSIEGALASPAAIFHYVGHTDQEGERGYLVREVVQQAGRYDLERLYSDELASLLRQAGAKLAVFSACNSGYRAFVEPMLGSGLPALVGIQGIVTNLTTGAFCDVLYRFLAAGLSLDEAVTAARAALVQKPKDGAQGSFDWGRFMVYLAAQDAVLLPRPESMAAVKEHARQARQVIINVAGDYIRVGNITNAEGIAIGRNAQANIR